MKSDESPRALGPHLDYHQDEKKREDFHQKFPPMSISNRTEAHVLLGLLDTEEEKLGVMLGVWKPLYPSEVCDYPLAVMDAATFKPENQIPYELHINFIVGLFHNLNSAISYSPDQSWYYYSRQSTTEVLIFHQFTKVNIISIKYFSLNSKKKCRESGWRTLTPPSSTETARPGLRRKRESQQN